MAQNNRSLLQALDEAPISFFHMRAAVTAGMGFFTDAYDLFIIGMALVYLKPEWHLTAGQIGLLGSGSLLAAFFGALIFGRLADLIGRKTIYGLEATLMVIGALACAFAPDFTWLLVFRFILGFGIGGDYPMSAVLMSEYSNAKQRGSLVSLVFGMQGLGLVFGPVVALTLEAAGLDHDIIWRIMLGLGALPPLAVLYLRRTMPESPRYKALVRGQSEAAARDMARYSEGQIQSTGASLQQPRKMTLRSFLGDRRNLLMILGTAGSWFLLDYAFYGNVISTPQIIGLLAPHASLVQGTAWALVIFAVAAVPGYLASILLMDRIGHRRLQMIGFAVMAISFGVIAFTPGVTHDALPFLLLYGASFFFTEFGPNCTTFVIPAEVFPTGGRTTGHGIAAGIGKLGAFVGTFLFPFISHAGGLKGAMMFAAGVSFLGLLLTQLVLPETSGRSLEALSAETHEGRMEDDPRLVRTSASR